MARGTPGVSFSAQSLLKKVFEVGLFFFEFWSKRAGFSTMNPNTLCKPFPLNLKP